VTHVLVHEIGHHFGLSDPDMKAIEAAAEENRAEKSWPSAPARCPLSAGASGPTSRYAPAKLSAAAAPAQSTADSGTAPRLQWVHRLLRMIWWTRCPGTHKPSVQDALPGLGSLMKRSARASWASWPTWRY